MCDLKCPDWIKKCVVDIVYYKKKKPRKTYGVSRDNFFLFHTVMYRHFLNLISQDFWCPHLFVSADITVPVLYIKDTAVKRSQSHKKVNCKFCQLMQSTNKITLTKLSSFVQIIMNKFSN